MQAATIVATFRNRLPRAAARLTLAAALLAFGCAAARGERARPDPNAMREALTLGNAGEPRYASSRAFVQLSQRR
jgi:hypothetical protein